MPETPASADSAPPPPSLPLPLFWPVAMVAGMEKAKADLALRNLEFVQEEIKLHGGLKAKVASPNIVRLDLRTMTLRDYGRPGGLPTLVNAPFAGHRAMIADYHKGQSLVETLLAGGVGHVALTDWKSASEGMKDFDVDNYLEELIVAIDDLGGRVNLVGLCQGGRSSAMVAARFPDKVNALVLAGSPIDTDASDGPIKRMAHDTPMSAYEYLVRFGGGLMRGQIMLAGWKNMHPEKHYVTEDLDFYQHMDDPAYRERVEVFDSWYEDPLDLPGRWYLQAIHELFKENRLARGEFVGLGRRLNLKSITCPLYLLAGESDDITTREQVFAAENLVGTPKGRIEKKLVPGGHIGLFHGLARAQGDVADDRAAANSFELRLTLGSRGLALVDPVGGHERHADLGRIAVRRSQIAVRAAATSPKLAATSPKRSDNHCYRVPHCSSRSKRVT